MSAGILALQLEQQLQTNPVPSVPLHPQALSSGTLGSRSQTGYQFVGTAFLRFSKRRNTLLKKCNHSTIITPKVFNSNSLCNQIFIVQISPNSLIFPSRFVKIRLPTRSTHCI